MVPQKPPPPAPDRQGNAWWVSRGPWPSVLGFLSFPWVPQAQQGSRTPHPLLHEEAATPDPSGLCGSSCTPKRVLCTGGGFRELSVLLLSNLLERHSIREGGGEKEGEIFHLLFHSLNAHTSWGGPGNARASSLGLSGGCWLPNTRSIFCYFARCVQKKPEKW